MQMKIFFTILIIFIAGNRVISQNQLPKSIFRDGLLIFEERVLNDSVPQDVLFFPCHIDNGDISDIAKSCFNSKTKGYFVYFQVMRHTQQRINRILAKQNLTIDSSRYFVCTDLVEACTLMSSEYGEALNFPALGGKTSGKIIATLGRILFEEYDKSNESQIVDKATITLFGTKFDVEYYYSDENLGTKLAYFPLKR